MFELSMAILSVSLCGIFKCTLNSSVSVMKNRNVVNLSSFFFFLMSSFAAHNRQTNRKVHWIIIWFHVVLDTYIRAINELKSTWLLFRFLAYFNANILNHLEKISAHYKWVNCYLYIFFSYFAFFLDIVVSIRITFSG